MQLKNSIFSSLGKKYVIALTGLGLGIFVIVHLLGNLTLYLPEGMWFNMYADSLQKMGVVLLFAEVGLAAVILIHAIMATWVSIDAKAARPISYKSKQSKGIVYSNTASRNMIITGLILLGFIILHIIQFRLGPGISQGYVSEVHGEKIRDLHRLVHETFQNPLFVGVYVAVMFFLGVHLRHGYWSLFQSLGTMSPRFSRAIYLGGTLLAVILAAGFLFIPIWIYFDLNQTLHFFNHGGTL